MHEQYQEHLKELHKLHERIKASMQQDGDLLKELNETLEITSYEEFEKFFQYCKEQVLNKDYIVLNTNLNAAIGNIEAVKYENKIRVVMTMTFNPHKKNAVVKQYIYHYTKQPSFKSLMKTLETI